MRRFLVLLTILVICHASLSEVAFAKFFAIKPSRDSKNQAIVTEKNPQNFNEEKAHPTFELARINGSKFISEKDFLGKKTILIFFDLDCPPCVKKLKWMKEANFDFSEINIALINLLDLQEVKQAILAFGLDPKIELLQAPKNPRNFLRKFGNNSGKLPFLVLLSSQGKFCLSKSEIFTKDEIESCF